jgi:photosystem II stability/assembly factor-like uncharacterized protein
MNYLEVLMSVSPLNRLSVIVRGLFFALLLSGCGVFEVGIERTSTPAPVPPTVTAAPTAPAPTPTALPGRLKPGQAVKILSIHMLNKSKGWAISQVETDLIDHLLFTRDGGNTWQDRTPEGVLVAPASEAFDASAFFDAQGGAWVTYSAQQPGKAAVSAQGVWRSTDEGATWQGGQAFDISGVQADFFSVSELGFLDGQHGWALAHLGVGMSHDIIAIFVSADGGQTWQRVVDPAKNPELMACAKTGLSFASSANGWLAGNCPGLLDGLFFYATSDGGQSWQPFALAPAAGLPADFFSKGSQGCGIPGLVYSSARAILFEVRCSPAGAGKTTAWLYVGKDNGQPEARRLPAPFGALMFISPDEGWMVGALQNDLAAPGGIYHTTDGGLSWTQLIATAWQGVPDFVDGSTGWVVARSADKLALVVTQDGGATWQALKPVIGR